MISLSHGVSQSGTFSRTTTPNVAADTAGGTWSRRWSLRRWRDWCLSWGNDHDVLRRQYRATAVSRLRWLPGTINPSHCLGCIDAGRSRAREFLPSSSSAVPKAPVAIVWSIVGNLSALIDPGWSGDRAVGSQPGVVWFSRAPGPRRIRRRTKYSD